MNSKGIVSSLSYLALMIPALAVGASSVLAKDQDALTLAQNEQPQVQESEPMPQAQPQGDLVSMTAEEIEGMKVVDQEGKDIGSVKEVVQNKQDKSLSLVVGTGGFWGIGEKKVVAPIDQFRTQADKLEFQGAKDQLTEMAEYDKQQFDVVPEKQQLVSIMAPQVRQLSFIELDKNNDGYISEQEAEIYPPLSENLGQYDQNQDNRLDRSEFSAFEQEQQSDQQRQQQQLREQASFEEIDQDGNEYISVDEAQNHPQLSQDFSRYDVNQDDKLDRAEFSAFEAGQRMNQ